MNWFYNLKIGRKLIISFFMILALNVILGIVAMMNLKEVRQNVLDMGTNWMPSIQHISDMNTNTSDYRIAEIQHILSTAKEDMEGYEKDMAKQMENFKKNQVIYEKLISSPEEQKLYDEFKVSKKKRNGGVFNETR